MYASCRLDAESLRATGNEMPHSKGSGRHRFERVYDALSALSLMSVLGALYFGGMSLDTIGDFGRRNEIWSKQQFALTDLQRAATFLIAPGNDVLRTKDVAGARATRDRAAAELDATIARFSGELDDIVPRGMADQLTNAFDMLHHERKMMIEASDKVFDAVASGDTDQARLAMVDMDRRLFELGAIFTEFNRIFQEIQRAEFDGQQSFVRPIERLKYAIAGIVTLFAAGTFLYGIRLRRRIRAAEASEQHERAQAEAARQAAADQKHLATIGKVAATVSHELRNPLAAIRTSTALLRASADSALPEHRRALDRIERSVQRCSNIIQDLLTFTEPKALRREATALDEWIEALLRGLDLPSGIELAVELSNGGILAIDRQRMGVAVGNLLNNAAAALTDPDWTPPPGYQRRIELVSLQDDEGSELTVRDNGPGIAPHVLARAFEPLFTTRNFGVGLGLPIARQIVEAHGGSLTLQSSPGDGTAARLWLPRATLAKAAA